MKRYVSVLMIAMTSIYLHGQIAITEISYNPPEANTDSLEYLELYNAGETPRNLKGFRFSAGVEFTFPDTVLLPGKYMLLTVNTLGFKRAYGIDALQWTAGALNNSGEIISIVDSLGNPVISVDLKDKAPWPTVDDGTDGNGKSIEICNPKANPNKGENWKVSKKNLGFAINGKQIFGTPGTANSVDPCSAEPDILIDVTDNAFVPKDVTINIDQTVRWLNKGGTHNVNGSLDAYPNNPEGFFSGAPSADAWTFDFKFTKQGVYTYRCDVHGAGGMTGTVTVNGPVVVDPYPVRTIASVTAVNGDGVPDSLNVLCTLTGKVYGVNLRPTGLQFTIIDDDNNGIGAFSNSSNYDYTVTEGDEVEIKGVVSQFNGFTQMTLNGVRKISERNQLIAPKEVTSFSEGDESSLVVVSNLMFTDPSQWTGTGSGFNVTMTNGTSNFTIRIDNDVDAYTAPIPSSMGGSTFSVTGLLGQFDNSLPYTDGYQLLPRYLVDFSPAGNTEEAFDPEIRVYPNPFTHVINIVTSKLPEFVEIFDVNGKLVGKIENNTILEVSELSKGWYSLKIGGEGRYNVVRVLKL